MFKPGTRIEHLSVITSSRHHILQYQKSQRSRSQRNVTYPVKNCNNSVLGGRIKFVLGNLHEKSPLTIGAQNGCHGNAECLETGTLILQFKIEYFKD